MGFAGGGEDSSRVLQRECESLDQPALGQDEPIERIVGDVALRPGTVPHHAKRRHEVADRLSITAAPRRKGLQSLAIQVFERARPQLRQQPPPQLAPS